MCNKYKKFVNIDETVAWGKMYYAYWMPDYQLGGRLRGDYNTEYQRYSRNLSEIEMTKLVEEALENQYFSYYCGGNWGLAINEKLRYNKSRFTYPENEIIKMQNIMDKRLNISYIPENIWGYRLLNYKDLCTSLQKNRIIPGTIIEDKGYMGVGLVESTLIEEFGRYDTMLKIMIPKGTNGLYLNLLSNRSQEQEVLFARGSRLLILFRYARNDKKIFICKMLK